MISDSPGQPAISTPVDERLPLRGVASIPETPATDHDRRVAAAETPAARRGETPAAVPAETPAPERAEALFSLLAEVGSCVIVDEDYSPADEATDLRQGGSGPYFAARPRCGSITRRARTASLDTALGYVQARDRLGQSHWIVLAVQGERDIDAWDDRLSQINERFLLVLRPGAAGADSSQRLAQRLQGCGWTLAEAPSLSDHAILPAWVAERLTGNVPTVVVMSHDPEQSDRPICTQNTAPDWIQAVVDAASELADQNAAATFVVLSRDHCWKPLIAACPNRAIVPEPEEFAQAIAWCGALAEAGCPVFVSLSAAAFRDHLSDLATELASPGGQTTLLVEADPLARKSPWSWDAEDLATINVRLAAAIPGVDVVIPATLDALRERIEAPSHGLTLIQLPQHSLRGASDRSTSNRSGAESTPTERIRISDDSSRREHELVRLTSLSPTAEHWARRYSQVGHRERYLWQWCLHGLELTRLSCVDPALTDHVRDTKLLAVIYGVLLDDVADRDNDAAFLELLCTESNRPVPPELPDLPRERRRYAEFTCDIWREYHNRLRAYPRYAEFRDLLAYDNAQVLNTMQYAQLVNTDLALLNQVEHDAYSPHNMQMMTFATVDLMCSPAFDRRELGALRQAVWHAQCMGRIGNLVSTWEREVEDGDFTSGVFVRALETGAVSVEDLQHVRTDQIRTGVQRGKVESHFLDRWHAHRDQLRRMVHRLRSCNLSTLVTGLDRLIHMELGSRGWK